MDYNFNSLDSRSFEHLIQALSRKILGDSLIAFGDGPDGGREATFEGKVKFPNENENWGGKWILQAKFKTREDNKNDFNWLKARFEEEMEKFKTRKVKVEIPDNYLLFTNVVLTPTAKVGGRDKIEGLIEKYKPFIKNIKIFGPDDLKGFLENNRDVATAYSSFILPGDILMLLYKTLHAKEGSQKDYSNLLGRFLEAEFRDDLQSRLDHAGKLTSNRINLEKVFVDLFATEDGTVPDDPEEKRFVERCIEKGNSVLRPDTRSLRYVLVAGPGYGKSTLTQFLCQIYRAFFLKQIDRCANLLPEVSHFVEDLGDIFSTEPVCFRFPFRILLRDFAGWIAERKKEKQKHTVLLYLKHRIEKKGHGETIEVKDIEQLLRTLSFVFVFDGLDEVPASSNREYVLEEINNFIDIDLRRYNCDAMIIATTRPQGYTKEFDGSRYKHLTVTDLEEEDCLRYLGRLLKSIDPIEEERSQHLEILADALDDQIISRLMKSPLQASIMAILVKSGGEPPRNKYDLFTEYYDTIFRRERQKGICKILSDHPDYIHDIHYKLGFTLQLSAELITNPSANISTGEFKKFVFEYLVSLELSEEEAGIKTDQILQATTERLVFLEEVEDNKIGFNIRSIQEYFAANYYMQHQPDDVIRERLNYICMSSYWRNTFLFILGYIYKHKNYLIDTVESICLELNGSTDEPNNPSASAISKLGSWLALDILIEEIFRGNPKFENKFARLLEDLFTIAPNENHVFFAHLSVDILKRWILKYIEKHISIGSYNDQITGWTVGAYLLRFTYRFRKYLITVLDKYWLGGADEVKLIKYFVELSAIDSKWFARKFTNALKKNPPFTFYGDLKVIELPRAFTSFPIFNRTLISLVKKDPDLMAILIQVLFFLNLTHKYEASNYFDYLEYITGVQFQEPLVEVQEPSVEDSKVGDSKICVGEDYVLKYTISVDDSVDDSILGGKNKIQLFIRSFETFSVKNNHRNIPKLRKLFSEYKTNYLKLLMDFLMNPDLNFLKEFFLGLKGQSEDVIKLFQKESPKINWLLAQIFHTNESVMQAIKNIEKKEYGDLEEWLDLEERFVNEEKFNYKAMTVLKHFHLDAGISGTHLGRFYKTISSKMKSETHGRFVSELLHFLITCFLNMKPKGINFFLAKKKNKSMVNELILSLHNSWQWSAQAEDVINLSLILLTHLEARDQQNIYEKVNNIANMLEFGPRINENAKYLFLLNRRRTLFEKISRMLKANLDTGKESSLIRIPVWIALRTKHSGDINVNRFLAITNFDGLYSSAYEAPLNEISRILLCTLNPKMDSSKAEEILKVSKDLVNIDPSLPLYFIRFIEIFKIKGDWVEPFLMGLLKLVKKDHSSLRSIYATYLKDMLESRPSKLNAESVRKELNIRL